MVVMDIDRISGGSAESLTYEALQDYRVTLLTTTITMDSAYYSRRDLSVKFTYPSQGPRSHYITVVYYSILIAFHYPRKGLGAAIAVQGSYQSYPLVMTLCVLHIYLHV